MANEILVGELPGDRKAQIYCLYPLDGTTVIGATTMPAAVSGVVPTPASSLPQWAQDALTTADPTIITALDNGTMYAHLKTLGIDGAGTPAEAAALARTYYEQYAGVLAAEYSRRNRFLGTLINYV